MIHVYVYAIVIVVVVVINVAIIVVIKMMIFLLIAIRYHYLEFIINITKSFWISEVAARGRSEQKNYNIKWMKALQVKTHLTHIYNHFEFFLLLFYYNTYYMYEKKCFLPFAEYKFGSITFLDCLLVDFIIFILYTYK